MSESYSELVENHSIKYKDKFNTSHYLKSYCSQVVPAYAFYIRSVVRILRDNYIQRPKVGTALDFGGGPSLWLSFLIAQYADSIQFCDFTSGNLQAVHDWLNRSSNAHDWTTFFLHILREDKTREIDLLKWENDLRQAFVRFPLKHCDINDINCPILSGPADQYDIIVSCDCLEAACLTRDSYKQAMRRLVRVLKPGGLLILLGVIECSFYTVGNERFFSLVIDEQLVREALQEAGINLDQVHIENEKVENENKSLCDYNGCRAVSAIKSNF
jgi:hypothetical protein